MAAAADGARRLEWSVSVADQFWILLLLLRLVAQYLADGHVETIDDNVGDESCAGGAREWRTQGDGADKRPNAHSALEGFPSAARGRGWRPPKMP